MSKFKYKSKLLDSASLVNESSSPSTLLHKSSVSAGELTAFKAGASSSRTDNLENSQVHTRIGWVHNPFAAISRLMRNFLRRTRWLLSPKPNEYRIPDEHARAVYMRVLVEPWLLNVERAVITSLTLAFNEADLCDGFAIRYSIAVALVALQQIASEL